MSYLPQTAIVTIIEGRTVIQDFALSRLGPTIDVSTSLITITLSSGEVGSAGFTIANVGAPGSELFFMIQAGLLALNFSWIDEVPDEGVVDAGSSANIDVIFDATGLLAGIYEVDLLISSNDGGTPMVPVHVELTVLEPDIAVAPDNFDVDVEYGNIHEETMTISNNGAGTLHFEIMYGAASVSGIATSTHVTENLPAGKYPSEYRNRNSLGPNWLREEFGPIQENSHIAKEAISKPRDGVDIIQDNGSWSTVVTGTIIGWPESGPVFRFDEHISVVSNIQAWWSINRFDPDRGWFYGYNPSTEVAHVTGIEDICEITDASIYPYSEWSIGPVDEGDFVLFHNVDTDYYAALRVNDIYGPEPLSALLDVMWYFQEDGSSSFGPCVPILVDPMFGEVPPGGSTDVTVTFDATDLAPGAH